MKRSVEVLIPAAAAAVRLSLTREAVIRRIQRGEIPGQLLAGRWMVERSAVPTTTDPRSEAGAAQ